MVVLKFHAMSIVCIHGSQVCYGWAPDGPQAMGPFLGLPKEGRKLDMCQIFVQNLSKQGIQWYEYIVKGKWLLDKRWTDLGFLGVQRLSNFCPLAGWPDGKGVNSHVQRLTTFCRADFLSILVAQEDKPRTNVGSEGQILDLARTKVWYWRQILVKH